jgi:hypothetical protein
MLYLTYNINICEDGLGAQYQRIIGIIALANKYNCIYVHTPIINIEHTNNIKEIENYFNINKYYCNVNDIIYDEIITISDPYEYNINNYKSDKHILLKIFTPYNILDKNPEYYNYSMKFLQIIKSQSENFNIEINTKKIAIHIRRGDVSKINNNSRYISIETYIKIINTLNKKYKNSIIYILTEINKDNYNEFDILKTYKNIILLANYNIIKTLDILITADILIISKSSFSYLAALYNPNIIYYFNFWHSKLSHWNNVDELLLDNNSMFYNFIKNIFLFIFNKMTRFIFTFI